MAMAPNDDGGHLDLDDAIAMGAVVCVVVGDEFRGMGRFFGEYRCACGVCDWDSALVEFSIYPTVSRVCETFSNQRTTYFSLTCW